ncbi:MAG TPA: 2-oxoglutarate dehydrogenase E1 component [Anaerolineae bacterium]|nr:2-oxoglutarate dehydrogenase E1 component [Anaerolineae bacterium]
MDIWQAFHGPNAGYILELYEKYEADPNSVDAETRALFSNWTPPTESELVAMEEMSSPAVNRGGSASHVGLDFEKIHGAVDLLHAIREEGHLEAEIDPLGRPRTPDNGLRLETYYLTQADLERIPANLVGWTAAAEAESAWQVVEALRNIYCSSIGYDFSHLQEHDERLWLREAVESHRFRPPQQRQYLIDLLERLTQVETFELFLHRIFPGKTRFSIEGLDMMVPILDEILRRAGKANIGSVLLGMAHRGRLNVLTHILGKPYEQILAEFKDPMRQGIRGLRDDLGWTGDVKYHSGAEKQLVGDEARLLVRMAPNPSHLEHVNPVVAGMARAAGTDVSERGEPVFDPRISLPILIHGDAAFMGQGVVAETLNLSALEGYTTGGTLHIIANNQVGFTTKPKSSRSTMYASDLAKGFRMPIAHVNANDPLACIEVARLAIAYREKFHKDFVIDLVGYRRYGHNEGDEPRFTQPKMYALVDAMPTVREKWATQLVNMGVIDSDWPGQRVEAQMTHLQELWANLEAEEDLPELDLAIPPAGAAKRVKTAVSLETLHELNKALVQMPKGIEVNSKLSRLMKRRVKAFDKPDETTIDWATAENLALGSILAEGIAIRLTGEDVKRGTFSHRHATFYDRESGKRYIPLQNIPQAKAAFEIHNSPLTENATVGFEYGYNIQAPERLVIWEAQYGDFINGAQTMIDEFLVSGRAKWEQTPSLVLLLPHGHEGQGPDHSSGRPERFLQLAARTNMRIANPTTAAQYFHLLRRQALLLGDDPLPLIVFTPKSLLRHSLSASAPQALAQGRWQPVLADEGVEAKKVKRLVLCSGKVHVDMVSSEWRQAHDDVALVRVEQLYPFPKAELAEIIAGYEQLEEVLWVQEEPRNMGAWDFVKYHIDKVLDGRWPLQYLGRPRRSVPAEGSAIWHKTNQERIVRLAFAPMDEWDE